MGVLDARDPMGTRCMPVEKEIQKNRAHKHLIFVLNKVDLVPTWVSRRWVQILMRDYPTVAFHASISNPFGKNSLLNLLRQFSTLMKDKKHVTVGMIGYPNVGKSSVINTLKRKKVCKAAPVPGETKVWQYIAMTKRLYMLDCPGIVPPSANDFNTDCAKVLKGVVRAERIESPSDYIDEVLTRVKRQYLLQRYKLEPNVTWNDGEGFLSILGVKMGKLHKGGEPDIDAVARIVLYDWQRGRIPYFTPPPCEEEQEEPEKQPAQPSTEDGAAEHTAEPALLDGDACQGVAEPIDETTLSAAGADHEISDSSAAAAVTTPATSSSSNQPGMSAENEPVASEGSAAASGKIVVQQSFADLSCSLQFDNEDRCGEAIGGASSDVELPTETTSATGTKKTRRREATEDGAANGGAKKRRRKQRTAEAGSNGRPGAAAQEQLKPGSIDWKAVVAEFDM